MVKISREVISQLREINTPSALLVNLASQLVDILVDGVEDKSQFQLEGSESFLRGEVRRSLILFLRRRRSFTSSGHVKQIWNFLRRLFFNFESELVVSPTEHFIGLVVSAADGDFTDLSFLESVTVVFHSLGVDRCVGLFRSSFGFRNGVGMLSSLVLLEKSVQRDGCLDVLLPILKRRIENLENACGGVDRMVRCMLEVYFTRWYRVRGDLDEVVMSIVFHGSMRNQYSRCLKSYGVKICLEEPVEVSSDSFPNVDGLFSLMESIKDDLSFCRFLPLLMKEFARRIPSSDKDQGVESRFVFLAKLLRLLMESKVQEKDDLVLELIKLGRDLNVYKPTIDHDRLQLGFLDSLADYVFAKPQALKKRRLVQSKEKTLKLEFSQVMLEMEHRVLSPYLIQILQILQDQASDEILFLALLKTYSSVRQLSPLLSAVSTGFDLRKTGSQSLQALSKEVKKLSELETLDLLKTLNGIPQSGSNLLLLYTVVSSVSISEASSEDLFVLLQGFQPSVEFLQAKEKEDKDQYIEFLKFSLLLQQQLSKCTEWNPAVKQAGLEVEKLPRVSHEVYIESLALRLHSLYHQSLHEDFKSGPGLCFNLGQEVLSIIEELFPALDQQSSLRLESYLLEKAFVEWIWFAENSQLVLFLQSMLQRNPEGIKKLFQIPMVYSLKKFQDSFHLAFFTELQRLSCSDSLAIICSPEVSLEDKKSLVKKLINQQLSSATPVSYPEEQMKIPSFLDWIQFALKLPVLFLKENRILLELLVLVSSTLQPMNYPTVLLDCFANFSLETLFNLKKLGYLRSAVFHVYQFCRSCYVQNSTPSILDKSESALFAVLKQFLFQQLSNGNLQFFQPDKEASKKPWKHLMISAQDLLEFFMHKESGDELEKTFSVSAMSLFVRICLWCFLRRQKESLKCFLGPLPASWSAQLFQHLKSRDSVPDLSQLRSLLITVVLHWLRGVLKGHPNWTGFFLNQVCGLASDLLRFLGVKEDHGLDFILQEILRKIDGMSKDGLIDSECCERIGCFVQSVINVMKMDSEGHMAIAIVHLHLTLFGSLSKGFQSALDPQQRQDSPLLRTLDSLKKSLESWLGKLEQSELSVVGNYLLWSLQRSERLEEKFAALQGLIIFFSRSQIHQEKASAGRYLKSIYSSFWEDSFQPYLLNLAGKKAKKKTKIETKEKTVLFCSVLGSYYQCFSVVHNMCGAIPQKLTDLILKKIKRIVQGLYKKTIFMEASMSSYWFPSVCEFLKTAMKSQRTKQAVKRISPSWKSALQTLLQVLIIWEIEGRKKKLSSRLQAELQLGIVFSVMASCPVFKETMPYALLTVFRTLESLELKKFSRKDPFSKYFGQQSETVEWTGMLLRRFQNKISVILATLNQSQMERLVKNIRKSDYMKQQMQSLVDKNKQFTGFDG